MKLYKLLLITLSLIFSIFINSSSSLLISTSVSNEKVSITKTIYLTFDDGPSESTTKILNILEKYEIPATFFVVGPSYKLKNDLLKEIANSGHNIAIHSYTHEFNQIYKDKESFLKDFYECENWIKKYTNLSPKLYRFPGGSSNSIMDKETIKEIIKELENKGYKHVDWNVDSFDSKYSLDTEKVIETTINNIKENERNNIYNQIVLLHDNKKKEATINALPTIIEYCLKNNYKFKLLTEKSYLVQHVKRPT